METHWSVERHWKHINFFLPYPNNNNKLLAHLNITGSMQALICIEWLQVGGTLLANHGQVYMYL